MSIRRYQGIETEYGIMTAASGPALPRAATNPILLSSLLVHSYHLAAGSTDRPRWDYAGEDPLADARGFRLDRASAHPSLLTDDEAVPAPSGPDPAGGFRLASTARLAPGPSSQIAAGSTIVANGGRLYVDHAHPEYSSPEVTNPLDGVRWDRAGELMMGMACQASLASPLPLIAYKNNVDGKGASYGTHENLTVDRAVDFAAIVRVFTPLLVSRTILTGAGRVGIGPTSALAGFQLAQRADYIESHVALETTLNRPIVNSRDEPHAAAERYRRLHLIIGDANCFDVPTYLKLGMSALVAWALENAASAPVAAAVRTLSALELADPVQAVRQVSRDLDLTSPLALADGRHFTAAQIQRTYLDALTAATESTADTPTRDFLARWRRVLDGLESDPQSVADQVEWVAKYRLCDAQRARLGGGWRHPKLAAMDVQWSDVRADKGLVHRLRQRGQVAELVSAAEVQAAVTCAPPDTRAWLRAQLLRYRPVSAAWEAVTLDVPGEKTLLRVGLANPGDGTAALSGDLFAGDPDLSELAQRLRDRAGATPRTTTKAPGATGLH